MPEAPQKRVCAEHECGAPSLAGRGRRAFLRDTIAHLSMLTVAAGKGRKAHAAQDGVQARRHLITIQPGGPSGYDSHSFHFGLQPRSMKHATLRTAELGNLPSEFETGPRDYTPRDTVDARGFVHPNYPHDPDVYLGPGMSIFQDTSLLRDTIQIVGGLDWLDGGHTIGVEVLNCGTRAAYAPGLSSLIARRSGQMRPLPLHYAQLAQAGSVATHVGLLGGRAEPVVIPDFQTLALITQFDPKADVPEARRGVLSDAVKGLVDAALAGRLALAQDRALYTDYFGSFTRALSIMTTQLTAPDSAFMKLWAAYQEDVKLVIGAHPFWTRVNARSGAKVHVDLPALTFRFALAEYLVTYDLSSVVDIAVPFQDAHLDNWAETAVLLAIYACYRRLLSNLRASRVSVGVEDRSLLDLTTVVMFSEFDRSACMSAGPRPGTGHGRAASLLLAGMGTHGGSVIGAIKAGPGQGPLPSLEGFIGSPLPVNAQTGRPDANGKPYLLENVFPTLLSLFDIPAPNRDRFAHGPINLQVKS